MVGGEDDAHVVGVVTFLHFHGEAFGIGGGGIAELVGEGFHDVLVLAALFPDLDIRADGEGMERGIAFLHPLGEDALERGHKSVRNNVRRGGGASLSGDEIGFTEECKARESGFQTACVCAITAGNMMNRLRSHLLGSALTEHRDNTHPQDLESFGFHSDDVELRCFVLGFTEILRINDTTFTHDDGNHGTLFTL